MKPLNPLSLSYLLVWLGAGCWTLTPAHADWLITLEGRLIETRGPWTIEDDVLTYTDLEGEEHQFRLDDLDLEASEETTAIKQGRPYVPRAQRDEADQEEETATTRKKRKAEDAKVILYTDAFCPSCSAAREHLRELGVDFVEKVISQDAKARREYKKKAGHGGGLPLIDVDGTLIFTYNRRVVEQRIEELMKKEGDEGD